MTPFRNDEQNPFGRRSVWPAMPQAPLPVGRWRRPAGRAPSPDEVILMAAEPAPQGVRTAHDPVPEPLFSPPVLRRRRRRRGLRLMPLLVSGALGLCGLAALYVVILNP